MALSRSAGQLARRGLRLSSMRLSTKPQQSPEELQELSLLDKFQEVAGALDAPLTSSTQTAQGIAQELVASVKEMSPPEKLKQSLAEAQSTVSNSVKALTTQSSATEDPDEAALRVKSSLLSQQVQMWASKPPPYLTSQATVEELASAILTADGQKRLEAYLRSFGPKINEPELQQAIGDYCHSTANTWSSQLQEFSPLATMLKPKKHQKYVKRFSKNFVRDKFDVSVKARCMYYWAEKSEEEKADPNMIKAPELVKIDIDSILKVQKQYFPEVVTLSQYLSNEYKKTRRVFYEAKRKRKEAYLYGAIFFVLVNIGDYVVQML